MPSVPGTTTTAGVVRVNGHQRGAEVRRFCEIGYTRSNTAVSRFFRTSSQRKHWPFIAT
jgi:hypothetical protein